MLQSGTGIRILLNKPLNVNDINCLRCTFEWFYSCMSSWQTTPPNFYQYISHWSYLYVHWFLVCNTCSFFFILLLWIEWKKLRIECQGQAIQVLHVCCREHFHFAVTRLLTVSTKAHCPSRLCTGSLTALTGSTCSSVWWDVAVCGVVHTLQLWAPSYSEKWHTVREESGNGTRPAKSKMCPNTFTSLSKATVSPNRRFQLLWV